MRKKAVKKSRAAKKPIKPLKDLGRVLRQRRASKAKAKPRERALKLKRDSRGHVTIEPVLPPRPLPTRHVKEIKIGARHRKDFGDVQALARSIDARGLLHPIVITPQNKLIAGQRRLAAWPLTERSQKGKLPIPVTVVDIDSIVAGEWDENAFRKDFTPTEMVAIKRELEPVERDAAKQRQMAGKASPEKKTTEGRAPRAADKVAKVAGVSRKTLERAEKVVEAAEQDPERFGALQEHMDRTGKVNSAHKRLQVMQQTDAIRKAPPPVPMNGPYGVVSIDCPWPGDADKDQDKLDAAGRSFRPYPEMSIDALCEFMRTQVAPILKPDVVVWFHTPNFHLVRGYAHQVMAALGLGDQAPVTMLSWEKDKMGRGQVLRDKTEHVIALVRGKPVINVFGKDPPTTMLRGARRENSQKPEEFYRLVERVTPAERYAAIFSTGGEGRLWDGHGDQVGKHAPPVAPEGDDGSPVEINDMAAALHAIAERGYVAKLDIASGLLNKIRESNYLTSDEARLTAAGKKKLAALEAKKVEKAANNKKNNTGNDAQATDVTATSEYQADMGFPNVERYRETPAGQLRAVGLVEPGNIVRTSYDSGPYRVVSVDGPDFYKANSGEKFEHWSLSLCRLDAKPKKGGKYKATAWINELVAVDGRLLFLFEANDDEVFVDRPDAPAAPAESVLLTEQQIAEQQGQQRLPIAETPVPDFEDIPDFLRRKKSEAA